MALESVPPNLLNSTGEHCFQACIGMSLAHYGKLGTLTLRDIVRATEKEEEQVTPMVRIFEWVKSFGVSIEYIEELGEGDTTFTDSLQDVGVKVNLFKPTTTVALDLVDRGNTVITQVSYTADTGQQNFELDHAVFLSPLKRNESVLVLDPDNMVYGITDLTPLWGRYPNLISIGA